MKEAQAHEAVFPHLHPHPQWSAAQDLALTLLFLSLVLAAGILALRWRYGEQGRDSTPHPEKA